MDRAVKDTQINFINPYRFLNTTRMFDRIFIKKNKISDTSVDLGKLCEAILFYDKTDFLLDKFTVSQFVKTIDLEKLKEYSSNGIINLHLRNSAIGIINFEKRGKMGVGPVITKSHAFNLTPFVHQSYLEVLGDKKQASIKTDEFLELCSPLEYTDGFQNILESECEDAVLLTSQLKVYLNSYLPQLDLSSLQLIIEDKIDTPMGVPVYIFKSSINLDELNEKYFKLMPDGHFFDWSSFLLNSNESSGDINIASQFNAEIYTDIMHYPYIQNRVEEIVKKVSKSEKDINTFENIILEHYKPIRDSINSGEKSFLDFTEIIDKSLKFKMWLKEVENDSSLLAQYYEAVTKGSWIDKKAIKAARFCFFTAFGILGDALTGGIPIGSLVSSLSDNYLVPKLAAGWKPNQFIDDEVKPFLPKNE